LINLAKSLSWKASKKARYFKIENNENQIRVEKNNNRLACERYFWSSRRIPCEHIFCAVVCTSNNGDNVKSFLPNSDARWKLREIVDDNEIID